MGLVVFGLFHQVLVAPAPMVFTALLMACALAIPIVGAYARMTRERVGLRGTVFGVVVFAGLVPHYVLITVAMWGRTFDDGPRGGWELLAVASAPFVSTAAVAALWRPRRGGVWLAVGMVRSVWTLTAV